MRKVIILLAAALCLALPIEANATLQCVTYAREVTGLNLKGDAWKWWEAAQGVYDRGNAPKVGSVLVFKRQGKMSHGHVSVVRGTAGSRVVLVDHANWAPHRSAGRGQVTKAVPVLDVSPKNDWSEVRVWYQPTREYGSRTYKTQGFVYRPGGNVVQASLRTEAPRPQAAAPAELPVHAKAEPVAAPVRKAEPAVHQAPVVEAKVIEAKVSAPVEAPAAALPAASPASDSDLGKFDARAWAEQA
ncbi:CHAP domain-containing protein [Magnetospirillum sp. 15-1]|uniref:CHAP domain-containing protein n=1 Tax=Magnetospirillum sp. 15-1 TaxID=1979370 RepID=UPI001F5B7FF6|nr:CHAP domain-containing protein [Magnetospirillum sp. 15-1]